MIAQLGEANEHLLELLSILTQIHNLPSRAETVPLKREERNREKEVVKRRLVALLRTPGGVSELDAGDSIPRHDASSDTGTDASSALESAVPRTDA